MRSMRRPIIALLIIGTACSAKERERKDVAIPHVDTISIARSRVRANHVSCDLVDQNTYDELHTTGQGVHGDSIDDRNAIVPEVQLELPAFKIDKYTVGCEQWRACVASGACTQKTGKDCYDDLVQKTYDQAVELCRWRGGRLPTYPEWQRAVRGTSSIVTSFAPGSKPEVVHG